MNYPDFILYLKDKLKQFTDQKEKRLIVNEELQKMALQGIYTSKEQKLYFLGGTNLRLCYGLDRFSEDLDFSFHGSKLDLDSLSSNIQENFKKVGISMNCSWNTNTNVYKTFIKVPKIYYDLSLSGLKDETASIKLEIDINPPSKYKIGTKILKSALGSFAIGNYDLSTTFAGKIGAVFTRDFAKGRDFYDLDWYFKNIKDRFNLDFLIERLKQHNETHKEKIKLPESHKETCEMLLKIIDNLNMGPVRQDIERFVTFDEETLNAYIDIYKEDMKLNIFRYEQRPDNNLNNFKLN